MVEETSTVPYAIARVFTITSPGQMIRGQHAHKKCHQFMHCILGTVKVVCFDGRGEREFTLNANGDGLLVPAGNWAHQEYLDQLNVLNVYCDLPYDPKDYIHDKTEFINQIGTGVLK